MGNQVKRNGEEQLDFSLETEMLRRCRLGRMSPAINLSNRNAHSHLEPYVLHMSWSRSLRLPQVTPKSER